MRGKSKQKIGDKYRRRCAYCTFDKKFKCGDCYNLDVFEGLIYCSCGIVYPIIKGIPRMILDAFKENSAFYFKYKKEVDSKINKLFARHIPDGIKKTQKSFGQQWRMFDYSDRTWGRTPDERKKEVLIHFDVRPGIFKYKLFLDAGCGNGIEAAVITDFGTEVIGIDLSDSVERAHKFAINLRKKNLAPVHYVQADIMNPPFPRELFDFISSSGVLHHTPNTKKAFDSIAPLCKKEGMLWVWLYQRERWIAKSIEVTKVFTRKIPLRFIYYFCYAMAPFYQLFKSTLNLMGLGKYPPMSFKENVVSLSDTITPPYAFNHTPQEVFIWYKENGFKNIKVTWKDRCGFGILGVKR